MGSECVTTTTIMFTPKSLLLLFVFCVNSQTFYHTSDIGGSYTRVSHGTNSGFSAPAPAYTKPVVTTSYNQPAPPPSTTYHQPHTTYQKPAQTYHQPATTHHPPLIINHIPHIRSQPKLTINLLPHTINHLSSTTYHISEASPNLPSTCFHIR